MPSSLPYHEPDIIIILVLSSFLLLLNYINSVMDKLLYCGLIGQVFLGMAWGSPGAQLLSVAAEETIVQLGYLGLMMIVYEGGLSTSFTGLKANIWLSTTVAVTGIVLPIALSFVLQRLVNATALQSFAAGAALCSTSLGTTFTVLRTSGLSRTRLGVVLSSAAMMDDVVGLVMVQVISNLGTSGDSFDAVTVVRPVFVSVAFVIVLLFVCRWLVKPLTVYLNARRQVYPGGSLNRIIETKQMAFVLQTSILLSIVASASYAGTTNLFAAYIAGAAISWWDTQVPHRSDLSSQTTNQKAVTRTTQTGHQEGPDTHAPEQPCESPRAVLNRESTDDPLAHLVRKATSGKATYERYHRQGVERILKPFFFASIGFSIPISKMFTGAIVWRGIIYSLLMALAKMACGAWLVRIPLPEKDLRRTRLPRVLRNISLSQFWGRESDDSVRQVHRQQTADISQRSLTSAPISEAVTTSQPVHATSPDPKKPISLYPPAMLSSAMVARGEIGFLISALAESKGIFASQKSTKPSNAERESEIFLIVTWAIVLCTIIGPVALGSLVRRVNRMEMGKKSGDDPGEESKNVLGVWGTDT